MESTVVMMCSVEYKEKKYQVAVWTKLELLVPLNGDIVCTGIEQGVVM
jgi:hypothetical protein